MSLPRKTTINCPQCGKSYETTVFQSVNTGYAKDVAKKIISGELFEAPCPHCGFVAHMEYDVLYNDMNHGAMIWVVHDNTPDFESRVAEVRSTNVFHIKTTRIVTDVNALREKVSCLEKGRDDRIIELCKVFVTYNLLSEHPDFNFRNAFYMFHNGKELIFIYDMDGNNYGCELSDDIYNHWHDRYFNSEYANEFDGNYPIVDYDWAQPMLGLLLDLDSDDYDSDTKEKTESEIPTMHNEVLSCPNCKNQLPQDSEFCQYCGRRIEAITEVATPQAKPPKTPKQESSKQEIPKARKAKKPVNKKLVICLIVIPIVLALVVLLTIFLLVPSLKYNHANKLLENGNYELAYSEFLKLDGFSDSENMLLECRYVQAVKYRDSGDYELANTIFESLGDYRDSKILIHKHEYNVCDTVAATCTMAGSETYKCTGCDDTYTKSITQTHSYVLSASEYASCQKEGYKTYKCSFCNDEYSEKLGKTSHKFVVTSTQAATCTKAGAKHHRCSTCGYEYSEEIAQKAHSYSSATCTTPKTCTSCAKTEGKALGHSTDGVVCSRCGEITFETLTYSGKGSKVIKNIVVPKGKFLITVYATGGSSLYLDLRNSFGNEVAEINVYHSGNVEKAEAFSGSITGGYIEIDTSASWTITIEAVGN